MTKKKIVRFLVSVIAVAVSLVVLSLTTVKGEMVIVVEAPTNETPQYTYSVTKSQELQNWTNELELKELDLSYPRNYCKIDTDGIEVCGCLQYKYTTFLNDATKYKDKVFPNEPDIMSFYKNCEAQKALAMHTVTVEPKGWSRWYTSVITRGLGLPPL